MDRASVALERSVRQSLVRQVTSSARAAQLLRPPTDNKLKGLKLGWFSKAALRGFLPDEILTKKKKRGPGLPFGVWATWHVG